MICKLKVIFAEHNIEQREFAKEIGINEGTLSAIARNKQFPSLMVAYKIAAGLRNRGINVIVEDIWVKN